MADDEGTETTVKTPDGTETTVDTPPEPAPSPPDEGGEEE